MALSPTGTEWNARGFAYSTQTAMFTCRVARVVTVTPLRAHARRGVTSKRDKPSIPREMLILAFHDGYCIVCYLSDIKINGHQKLIIFFFMNT